MSSPNSNNNNKNNNNNNAPAPKLARPVYNLCDSDDSDDSNSDNDNDSDDLEILAPINPRNMTSSSISMAATKASTASVASKKPIATKNSISKLLSVNLSDSDSDDDDDLMAGYNLKRKQQPLSQSSTSSTTNNKRTNNHKATARPRTTIASRNSSITDKEEKHRERQRAREKKARQKEDEKAARANQRALLKETRERTKLQEQNVKKRQREEFQQVSGKYAHQEIVLLLDLPIYLDEELALTSVLSEDFLLHPQPVAYKIPNSIQWIRKDYIKGGAKDAVEQLEQKNVETFERSPYLLVMMEANEFLPLLDRVGHEVDDSYPALEQHVMELQAKYQLIWKTTEEPRIIFLLRQVPESLDKIWKNHKGKKKTTGASPPTEWELNDAIQWLLIQFQVECLHCPSIESTQDNVHKLTRGICEAPYRNQVTELECIKKIKSSNTGERPIDKAQDAWFRQLQQAPRLSENMALNAVKEYPTLQSLWQVYNQNGEDDTTNAAVLQGSLSNGRIMSKLSHTVFRILKSDDPREKLT
ncbi:MAG: hypothetical protein SGBAC_002507 [Bacillariaceae sp.]